MLIVKEKPQAGAGQSRTENGNIAVPESHGNNYIGYGRNGTGTCSQTVQPVRQIYGIRRADNHEEYENIIERPQIHGNGSERNPKGRRKIEDPLQDKAENNGNGRLCGKFLFRRQPEITFFQRFYGIVEKPDTTVAQGKEKCQKFRYIRTVENKA